MQAKLIQIGSSRGLRLPKLLIEKYDLSETLEIEEREDGLLIKKKQKPREDWAEQFECAASQDKSNFDTLINLENKFDEEEWEW